MALALIAWRRPNLLLLDEPTNHLDLDMREALAEALADFPGAIVLVSHDRHLIGLVCDSFWRVAGGRVEEFDGDLDAYAAWLRSRPATNSEAKAKAVESRHQSCGTPPRIRQTRACAALSPAEQSAAHRKSNRRGRSGPLPAPATNAG